MSYVPTTDPKFLSTLEEWFKSQPELLMVIRYSHAAGARDFELFLSLTALLDRIRGLPPRTCVTVLKEPQLPIRGIVDDSFIAQCLKSIPDGSEYLLVETVKRVYGSQSWFHNGSGESHVELLEELDSSRGVGVAVGIDPPWFTDNAEVISAVVPDVDGNARTGIY